MIRKASTASCHVGLGLALLMAQWLEQSSPKARADALVEQGLAQGKEQLEQTVPFFRAALELYEQVEDPRGQAESWLFLGTVEAQRQNMAAAVANYTSALDRLPLDDLIGRWLILLLRSQAELESGRCREAAATLEEALDTIRRIAADDRHHGLETLAAYTRQTYCPNALSMRDLAHIHPLLYGMAIRRLEALTFELAADCHQEIGQLETALALAEQALGFDKSMSLTDSAGPVQRQMGQMHLALGHYEEAAERFRQALEAARSAARWEDEIAILRDLAAVERQRGRFDEALARYREILDVAELMDAVEIESRTRREMCEVERAAKRVTDCVESENPPPATTGSP